MLPKIAATRGYFGSTTVIASKRKNQEEAIRSEEPLGQVVVLEKRNRRK